MCKVLGSIPAPRKETRWLSGQILGKKCNYLRSRSGLSRTDVTQLDPESCHTLYPEYKCGFLGLPALQGLVLSLTLQ